MISIGDIYVIKIFFSGKHGDFKNRPVLVINIEGSDVTIVEITSVAPKKPPGYYDLVKEEILGWEKCGLDGLSYVKCKNIHKVKVGAFSLKIGSMDWDEFEYIVEKIVEYNLD